MKTRIFLSLMLLICFCLSVTQAQNINRVEYFIDQDPGFGKGTALVINPNIVVSGTFSIPLSSMEIPNGLHLLAVRAKDVNNNWSVTSISTFMKDNITSATPLSYISYAEYFIDNDPGFGKGTTVNLEKSSQINNFNFTIPLAQDLPKGVHYLNFRVRDLSGKWSVVAIKPIFKEDSPLEMTLSNIAKVEYFIDKDPGFGKGYDVAFTTGTNINNLSFTANLSGVLSGEHQMFIRVKDTKGNWSSVGLRKFTLCNDATSIKINVPSSTTVCQGQSIQLSVPSGYRYQWQKNGNNIYDAIANTYQVTESGQYQVAIVNNSCLFTSNAVDIVVTAFPEKPSLPVNSVGICAGNSIVLDANGCDGILTWYDGNNIVDKLVSPSVTTNYRATCTKNGCTSEKSDILKVTVNTLLSAPIISSSLNDICQGTTVTLTASGCNGIVKWNDDSEGNTLTVKPNNTTTYSAFCKTNTCTSTNTSIIIKVKNTTANQTVINADNQTICNGSTVNLSSSGCTGSILWSTGAITKDITVSPSVNTTYSVICTQNNCIGTSVNAVKISVIPSIAALTISAKDVSICKGESTILSAGFCYGVTQWNNGDIGRSITVSPTISTTYTAVCLNNGCSSSVSNAIKINVSECENTAISITAIEYFIDKDPGLGKGTNVSITNASAITKDFNVSLPSTLSDGIHTLSVRAKDSKGSWTSVAIRPFVKQSLSQSILSTITQLEYFYDKDPGYGKGTQITVAKQNTIDNLNITLPISSSLSDGLHFLTIRAKDSKNSWGVSATKVFLKNVISNVALSNLTQLEYFVDIDPGNGKGIGIPFTSGQTLSNLTFDVSLKNLNLRDGEHFLQLRAKDNKGNWSNVGTKIFQSSNELVSIGSVANSYCNQQTVNIPYTVKGTFESDNEFIVQVSNSDGLFGDYSTEIGRLNSKINASIVSSIPNIVGDKYRIRIKSTNPVRYSDSKPIVFKQKPNRPTISNGSAIDFCKGGNVILSASSDEGNIRWSNGLISTQINASKVGEYYAISTLNGCSSDISNIITVTNNVPSPQAPLISSTNAVICSGQTAILRATGCLGTVIWSNGTSGININVSPTITTKYKAICSVQNCISDSSLATTITVLPKPTQPKITVSNATVCAGSSSVLTSTACLGGTLTWTSGLTGNSITVSPTSTKSYKVLCTINGCKSDSSLATTITVVPKPSQPKITASNSSICVGGSSVLTATACTNGTLTWTSGLTGTSITVSPTSTKSYKVLCTINGCKSDSSLATTITVLPKPSQPKITASNSSICVGGSSVLTSTACTNGTLTWTGGLSGNSITVSPTATKSYKALCAVNGCKSDSSLATTITILPKLIQPIITASNSSICVGGSSVLTSTACTNGVLTWTGGLTGSSITVSPTSTRSYKVLCTINGCKSDSSLATTITVIPKPTQPKITASNATVCAGSSSILTSTACVGGTLTWTGGLTGSSITVSPTATKSYKVLCTIGGCKSDSSLATTITVISKPTQPKITASNTSICVGSSSVLTSTACVGGTLTWTGGLTGSSITVSPTATKSYKVLCTINGCKSDSSLATTITVVAKPIQPKIIVSNSSICVGSSSVLTSTACTNGTLTWTDGLTGNTITASPTATKSYKALCTINGCKSDSSLATTITVLPKPIQPKITASNSSICVGSSSVLTSSACVGGTLTWTGGLTGSSITVSPTKTTTYKVLCTIGGCKSDSSLATTITIIQKPVQPKITANNTSICAGSSSVLTSTACTGGTLTWTGGLTGNSIIVSPTATKAYKVLCTIGGCKSDSSLATTITVIPKPTQPKITASNATVCTGSSSVLTSTACTGGTLTWTGGLTGNSIIVSPTATKAYKVLCTIGGCKSDSSLATTITVIPKPTQPKITASNATVCTGSSSVLTSTACVGGTLTWTGGLAGNSITVSPTSTRSYKVLCTIGGCKSDSSLATTINVIAKPTQPKITASNSSICVGGNSVLTSTACVGGTLTWTGGLTGSSITVSPTATKSYKVLCTIGGCKSDSSLVTTITVVPKPTQPKIIVSNSSICVGGSSVLTATACTNGVLTWTGGLTGSSITVSPTSTKSYKVLCTIGSCKSDSSLVTTITVTSKPTQPKITVNNTNICVGGSSILTATACTGGTLTWTGGLTGNSITVSPTATKSYKALCTINGCKSDSSLATTITILPKPIQPIITASNSSICVGGSSVLTSTACTNGVLTWTGGLTGNSITVSPTATKSYKVLCTIGGCKSDSSLATTITITPKPTQPKITASNSSICVGGNSVLTSTACVGGTLTWTGGLTGNSITVSPTATKSYKVLCTIGSCKSDSSLVTTITVTPKPNAPVISSNVTCTNSVTKQWDKTLKGNGSENIRVMLNLPDGGYIIGGENYSDITSSLDYWLVKTDAKGNKVWEKTFGGTKDENLASMLATADGGYVLLGISNSDISADKSEASRGTNDYWVIKVNANGTKVWDKTFGGNAQDTPKSIVATSDGGFILGGQSLSGLSGDKTEASKGTYDFWIVKINANGSKVWDKTFGGDNEEYLSKILITADGGYLLGGHSSSGISGNKSETSKGASDYWIVKINANGSKVWDKAFGGNSVEYLGDISTTSDGGFLLVGDSYSGLSGDKTQSLKGDTDYWAVKINANGLKIWDKAFGGNSSEYFKAIANTNDGGFILAGYSFSGISGDKSEASNGNSDYWAIRIDANGVKVWDKAFGGNSHDMLSNIITSNDGGFLLGGTSLSGLSGDKTDVGTQYQYCWIVKASVCNPNNITSSQKPTLTATGCTGTVTWSNGATGNSITVSPSTATTYTATCTVNGCVSTVSNSITVSVTVTKPTTPTITASNATICAGTNATLTASACTGGTLTWTDGLTGNSITVSPTATKTYKVVCSQNGIISDSSAAVTVTVNPKPTQPKNTVSNATICAGGSAVLSATACSGGTLTWTGGLTGASITVSPTATKSYKAICAINGCKSDSSLATTVNVLAKPNAPTITSKSTTVSSVVKQWEKTYGGNWYDNLSCVVPTQDGGYLLGGNSSSNIISGEKSEDIVGGWIVKINADGNKIWDKAYKDIFLAANGGIGLRSIIPTSDGGFLLGATSITNTGAIDFWLIKIDANGNKIWDKTFGGIAEDYLVKIISTSDGGFLIGGSSLSSGTNGYLDYLVIKVDANGNKQWTKFYGAAGHETLSSIIKTSDGGYLLAGDSHSNIGGDKSENSKGLYSSDYWIVKIDANGTKIWDKTLGGDNNDASPDIVQTSDGGFLLGGSSRSSISGDKSENYRGDVGYDDFWIVKLDSKGTKIWDKTFGGSMNDKLIKIMTTADGGFLLGGSSYSGIGLNKSEDTQGHWLIKMDANGQKIWDKTFGGIGTDPGIYDISPTSDGGYIFGGSSKSSNRQMDYWIVKIKENKTTTTTLNATGCTGTVTWSNGSTGNSITVSPSTATTYTATCTVNGCVSSASNAIKVNPDLTTTSTGSMYEAARLDANPSKPDTRIEFKVFPNPAKEELNVETDLEGEATIQLYNMIGQQVLESTFVKKTKIPLINLSKGSYFYLIQYQEYRKTGKVLLE
ncbi:hypothetical protein ABID42_004568 [Arcicella rosea]|uniref:T9SS type A sorting domain-containing protein n=1 Tax=Arcicella rosea TaxID=502909 RepID=UPI00345CC03C